MQQISSSQASPEILINENFSSLAHVSTYAKNPVTTTGLVFGYYGGVFNGSTIVDGTLTLPASSTVYVSVTKSTGAVSFNTGTANWNNLADYLRAYVVTTDYGSITSVVDHRRNRAGVYAQAVPGVLPLISKPSSYTITLEDIGSCILHPASASAATYTIPDWQTTPLPLGSTITIVNKSAAGSVTISATNQTLTLIGTGSTGSRTLAANGIANLLKISVTDYANEWVIYGTGIT